MKNIFEQLTDLLIKDERLVSQNGELLKNQTQELARKNDPELIKLLLSDKAIKQHFFFEVEKTLIFDKEKFTRFISNKQFLPDSYTAFKNKIGLTAGDEYLSESKEVVLAWPYKDCVLEGGMTKEDQKRDEIFYNETLAPDDINRLLDAKVFTNFKRIDKKGEHKLDGFKRDEKGTIKDNLIIKGNNLLALASLKKEFAGKVKLIYIDPPYNTGTDTFKYNDNFTHSTWLTFMKNRLECAKQLLSKEGVIFVQIDYNEAHYVKILLDEVFGREMFRNEVIWWKTRVSKYQSISFGKVYDIILFYSKSDQYQFNPPTLPYRKEYIDNYYRFIEKDTGRKYAKIVMTQAGQGPARKFGTKLIEPPRGKHWIWSQDKIDEAIKKGLIEFTSNGIPNYKKYADETQGMRPTDLWTDIVPLNPVASERLGLDGQKPEQLLQRIINTTTSEGDIILDFFAGSGSTGAVCHKLKRQYVCVEQIENQKDMMLKRLIDVIHGKESGISREVNWKGGGDFVYMELAKWNEEWIEKIEKAKTGKELAKLWDEMKETAFLSYKVDPKIVDASAKDFADLSVADQKKFLIECLDKNQLYVNLSEIEDKEYGVSKEDIKLNKEFYE